VPDAGESSVYDVDDVVPTWVYVPEELVPRYTLYPAAPAAEGQLTAMELPDDCTVADTLDGAGGLVVTPLDEEDCELSPALL